MAVRPSRSHVGLAALVAVVGDLGSASGQISARLEIVGPTTVTLSRPVVAEFRVLNEATDQLVVDAGWDRKERFRLQLMSPDGAVTTVRPEPPPLGGISRGPTFRVESGSDYRDWIVLNRWLDFSEVGSYELTVRFDGTVQTASGNAVQMVREWRHTITVTPRDVAELAGVASELRDVAMSSTGEGQRRAVMSLAYLTDPVAIPYLRDVVIANHHIGIAVAGIERIGGSAAAEVLTGLAANPDPEIAAFARAALRRIR